ncbi:MAG: hypothetical protein HN844_01290 [Planctomycetes bacterium]|jgi:fatty acid desaturase|nr:hypothetical protein [Planctomycetota bacterium]
MLDFEDKHLSSTVLAVVWLAATIYQKLHPKVPEGEEERRAVSWLDFILPVGGIIACGGAGAFLVLNGAVIPGAMFCLLSVYYVFTVLAFGVSKGE